MREEMWWEEHETKKKQKQKSALNVPVGYSVELQLVRHLQALEHADATAQVEAYALHKAMRTTH